VNIRVIRVICVPSKEHFNVDEQSALILTWDMERTKKLTKIER
jgi:hypothetical protein